MRKAYTQQVDFKQEIDSFVRSRMQGSIYEETFNMDIIRTIVVARNPCAVLLDMRKNKPKRPGWLGGGYSNGMTIVDQAHKGDKSGLNQQLLSMNTNQQNNQTAMQSQTTSFVNNFLHANSATSTNQMVPTAASSGAPVLPSFYHHQTESTNNNLLGHQVAPGQYLTAVSNSPMLPKVSGEVLPLQTFPTNQSTQSQPHIQNIPSPNWEPASPILETVRAETIVNLVEIQLGQTFPGTPIFLQSQQSGLKYASTQKQNSQPAFEPQTMSGLGLIVNLQNSQEETKYEYLTPKNHKSVNKRITFESNSIFPNESNLFNLVPIVPKIDSTMELFGCTVRTISMNERILVIAIVNNQSKFHQPNESKEKKDVKNVVLSSSTMMQSAGQPSEPLRCAEKQSKSDPSEQSKSNLLAMWMRYFYSQLEHEVGKKGLFSDPVVTTGSGAPQLVSAKNTPIVKGYQPTSSFQSAPSKAQDQVASNNPVMQQKEAQRIEERRRYLKIYESLDLQIMTANFNAYNSKMMREKIPYSKAKFLLSHMYIYQQSAQASTHSEAGQFEKVYEHAFLTGTARNVDFLNSTNFKNFLKSMLNIHCAEKVQSKVFMGGDSVMKQSGQFTASKFKTNNKRDVNISPVMFGRGEEEHVESPKKESQNLLSRERRKSVLSNYNKRTYNKETVTERYFGPYIVQQSKFVIESTNEKLFPTKAQTSPTIDHFQIILIFERNMKRKMNVNKRFYQRVQNRVYLRQDDKNSRHDRFIKAVEFFRFLFDPQRCYPFAQFVNKNELNAIKTKAKQHLLQSSMNKTSSIGELDRRSSTTLGPMALTSIVKLNRRLSVKPFLNQDLLMRRESILGTSDSMNQITRLQAQQSAVSISTNNNKETPSSSESDSDSSSQSMYTNRQLAGSRNVLNSRSRNNEQHAAPNISIMTLDLFENTPGGGIGPLHSAFGDDAPGDSQSQPNFRPVMKFGYSRGVGNQNEYYAKMMMDSDNIEDSEMEFEEARHHQMVMAESGYEGATLSVNNPVSDEVEVLLNNDGEMIEGNEKLYGVFNNTLVSISSINEFDGNKDWLAQQINCDDDDESPMSSAGRYYLNEETKKGGNNTENRFMKKNTLRELTLFLNEDIQYQPSGQAAPLSSIKHDNFKNSSQGSNGSILKNAQSGQSKMIKPSTFKHRNSIRLPYNSVQRVINEQDLNMMKKQQRRHSVRNIFGITVQTQHQNGFVGNGLGGESLSPFSTDFKKINNVNSNKKQPRRSIRINEANNIIIEAFDPDQGNGGGGGYQMNNIIEKVKEEEDEDDEKPRLSEIVLKDHKKKDDSSHESEPSSESSGSSSPSNSQSSKRSSQQESASEHSSKSQEVQTPSSQVSKKSNNVNKSKSQSKMSLDAQAM
ncbi:hypothetical protein FGO68_gene14808 [Halteria grandinella]|uniref:Uncharacterized protein n=1 Tax=Halteria grandinella TaxID=5974 RepID=A0A8J8T9E0_HALGN|nr:hypothetical protein FGO68_gene14808 [Halteria grandinella]